MQIASRLGLVRKFVNLQYTSRFKKLGVCPVSTKANQTVVMNTADLDNKIQAQLLDPSLYTRLPCDPTSRFSSLIKGFLRHLTDHSMLDPSVLSAYKTTPLVPAFIFPQIKSHKPGFPIRIITTGQSAPNLVLAKLIAPVLKQMSQCKHTVQNSLQLFQSYNDFPVPRGSVWTSFDIKAMFPSINQDLIINVITRRLQQQPEYLAPLGWGEEQFIDCLKIIFCTTYIFHKDAYYLQASGLPMGSCISSFLADIVGNEIDELIVHECPELTLYKRYVDDTLTSSIVTKVLHILNSFHPSLEFTMEAPPSIP